MLGRPGLIWSDYADHYWMIASHGYAVDKHGNVGSLVNYSWVEFRSAISTVFIKE